MLTLRLSKTCVLLFFVSTTAFAKHHHISVDTTPEEGFTIERDTYAQGSYYYPTFTQSYGEFSVGLSGQNLSIWDNQDSLYGMASWTHDFNDDLTTSVGIMAGSTFVNPQSDVYYYAAANYDLCDQFTLSVGSYVENSVIGFTTSAVLSVGNWSLEPSYVSGNGNMSGTSVNLNYQLNDNWQPYIGYGYTGGESYLALGTNFTFD